MDGPDVSMELVAVDFLPSDVLHRQLMLVSSMFAKGQLHALPMAGYGMKSVVAAMRLLAQASHVGKVVVSPSPAGIHPAGSPAGTRSSKASVAITGGSGGLGLLMAQWLAASGAVSSIHLYSRQGRLTPEAANAPPGLLALGGEVVGNGTAPSLQQWLFSSGVCVSLHSGDMSYSSDLHDRLAVQGAGGYPSSKGQGGFDILLHAAGVLQDSLIGNQTQSSIRAVMAPKLGPGGAYTVMSAAAAMPLQQLVLFSSVASTVGAAGQANYVSTNAVLDGWALSGRRQGAAVSSMQWGAWATAGMASAAVKDRLNRLGQGVLQPAAGLAALAAVMRGAAGVSSISGITAAVPGGLASAVAAGADAAAVVTVNPFKWKTYMSHMKVCCSVEHPTLGYHA
eukprot:GHUV01023710.1.p1 GENE.GHUV01023710.1~~GHUV01023710.1.p1  ORF type:complete len:421 (+),score=183.85 GHUV01023710.1:79-1263(+)